MAKTSMHATDINTVCHYTVYISAFKKLLKNKKIEHHND